MMDEKQLAECMQYFKERPVYEQILKGFCSKYISLGRVGGRVVLPNPSREEREQLQGLLVKINPYEKGTVTVTAHALEQALAGSRFTEVSLETLLIAYYGKPLRTKHQEKTEFSKSWDEFFQEFYLGKEETAFGSWLMETLNTKNNAYRFLKKKFKESGNRLYGLLSDLEQASVQLPYLKGERMRLPVFAACAAGNPHAYDIGSDGEKLLTYYICHTMGEMSRTQIFLTESRWEFFYRAGIIKDELSNYVLTYGISAVDREGRNHRGISGYLEENQPLHLSLHTLSELSRAFARNALVYVVENPAVFAAVAEAGTTDISAVCTNGQLCLASLVLLDLLAESGCVIYYAGDFDPEGLQIADKLKRKYQKSLRFWHYGEADYFRSKSQVVLSEKRLGKLDRIESEELKMMTELLRQEKYAGYQESLMDCYLEDITRAGQTDCSKSAIEKSKMK